MLRSIKVSNTLKIVITGLGSTAILLIIAMALYPNYNQLELTISKLGNIWPSSFFFSLALLIEASTLTYILSKVKRGALILFKEHKQDMLINYILYNIMILCIIGVVIFPSQGATSDIHDAIAITLFILMAITTTWISSIANAELEAWNKNVSYLGYICSISVVILGYLLAFGVLGPLIQKLTVVLFSVWVILMVYALQKYSIFGI